MFNIAKRLAEFAQSQPQAVAIVEPIPKHSSSETRKYKTITFAELDQDSDRIADALIKSGVQPNMRIALMVKQGIDFISLVFGMFKAGATLVLIDPGMGLRQMIQCLSEVDLDGFAAISKVHAVRSFLQFRYFPNAKYNLTVGHRWFWDGLVLNEIRKHPHPGSIIVERTEDDSSAIIFTSGSTGVAKGVLFTHGIFQTQIDNIQNRFEIKPGTIDLACFPFFGLFNAAMGVTAVIPDMDSTKPSRVNPENILEAIRDWNITQSFGSPALWNRVINYCEKTGKNLFPLMRVVSAGAPISPKMLAKLKKLIPEDGNIYTPYGATEALPVALISANEVLNETVQKTNEGGGICVGTKFDTITWKVIEITDEPIETVENAAQCHTGKIGELIVSGPQVTTKYVTRIEANLYAKLLDSKGQTWHRMGDVGYLDEKDRFWFCGRKSHRVETVNGPLYTIPCEAIFNQHEKVARSALVGISTENGSFKEPVVFIELCPDKIPQNQLEHAALVRELESLALSNPITKNINRFMFSSAFPVDVRHNAKINREKLAAMAEKAARW